ncbi:hypothetical protein B296_00022039 [Ensete ventricosum]|uniref:Uncharacterized protein n=1 Tax=Ensete ventricosum TaxID=4639 RepID=A0A426Z1C4_ENSVE|nr:hypothetical protein B296_00022039 [Ensete ventricosum]
MTPKRCTPSRRAYGHVEYTITPANVASSSILLNRFGSYHRICPLTPSLPSRRRCHGDMPEAVLETLRDPAGGAVQGNEVLACRGSSPCPAEARPHPPCCREFFLAFLYLVFFHYRIEPHFRRSIVINAAMTFGAFATAVRIIPVASRYVLRRSLFGFDINKKGTPQGAIKVSVFSPLLLSLFYPLM